MQVVVRTALDQDHRLFADSSYHEGTISFLRLIKQTEAEDPVHHENALSGIKIRRRVVFNVGKKKNDHDNMTLSYGGLKSIYIFSQAAASEPHRMIHKRPSLEQVVEKKRRGRPPGKVPKVTEKPTSKRKRGDKDNGEPDAETKLSKIRKKDNPEKPPPFALVKKSAYLTPPLFSSPIFNNESSFLSVPLSC